MGWFSDTFNFETLAPIAAGIILPGWGGVLAGSAIGAATSDDPLTGALTGGLGAYGGQSLASSFMPGGIGSLASSAPAATTAATGANLGSTAAAPIRSVAAGEIANTGISTGINPSFAGGFSGLAPGSPAQATAINYGTEGLRAQNTMLGLDNLPNLSGGFSPTANVASNSASAVKNPSFMEGLSNYGGGGKYGTLKGAGKLGFMGAGIMASGGGFDQEPMEFETPDEYKYDPTRQLNLGDDVDSGLRLLANGGYLEGGGVGDGMSDDIPATIDQEQPAALSEGEFVVPADVVAFAGNGSSEAGAQRFYKMLGDIREASTGQREQIKEIDVEEYMPMGGGIGKLA
jgi:hypothetical protein